MAETSDSAREKSDNNHRRTALRALVVIFLLTILLVSGYWWFVSRNRTFTDDAYVLADSAVVSSRVSGAISLIKVENDDLVAAGDVLAELDPEDYRAVVQKHKATLARIGEEIRVSEINISLTEAQTMTQIRAERALTHAGESKELEARHRLEELEQLKTAALADFKHAKRDLERYTNLYKEGAGSEQQVDRTTNVYKRAKAQCEAMDAQIAGSRASLGAILRDIERSRAQLDNALADRLRVEMEKHKLAALKAEEAETEAELQTAVLNLSYCTLRAPISGYIAQKRIQVGDHAKPGQALMSIVPLQDVYVEANFKETQLEDLHLGQPAELKSDIYPGRIYRGKVVGIRAGTGAAFSLLPPENATGNWIKVVQRIPVKIHLDEPPSSEYPLRVGSSLGVTVDTSNKSGPRLVKSKSERRS